MIICAVLALCFLVFIHEAGHFLAARAFGVRVTELMLGLPGPSIGFTRGNTRYGVTVVLLGGYARVCGMEAGEMSPHLKDVLTSLYRRGTATMEEVAADCHISDDEAYEALEELTEWGSCKGPTKKDQFNTYRAAEVRPLKRRKRGAKAGLSAGSSHETATGSSCEARSSAGSSREMAASSSREVTYQLGESRPVDDPQALFDSEYVQQYRSLPFWKRSAIVLAGPFVNLLFTIVAFVIIYSFIGVDFQNTSTGEVTHFNATPLQAVQAGFIYIGMVVQAVLSLFNPATAAQTVEGSASIVGIVAMSGSFFERGLVDSLFFLAMISVSLGIMNLLPIPPLDGGRFVVEVFQKLTSKVVSSKVMGYISMAGIALFLCFFAVMLNQDVQRLLTGFYS